MMVLAVVVRRRRRNCVWFTDRHPSRRFFSKRFLFGASGLTSLHLVHVAGRYSNKLHRIFFTARVLEVFVSPPLLLTCCRGLRARVLDVPRLILMCSRHVRRRGPL